jgi:hypothetical protein
MMYKSEMQRFIAQALEAIMAQGEASTSKLSPTDQEELAAQITNQIWSAGYELEPRLRIVQRGKAGGATAAMRRKRP